MPRRLAPALIGLLFALIFAASASAAAPPANTALPTISGTVAVGSVLSSSTGNWSSTTTVGLLRQWLRCDVYGNGCDPISGATDATYTLTSADVGNTVRVRITATNSGGASSALSLPLGSSAPRGSASRNLPDNGSLAATAAGSLKDVQVSTPNAGTVSISIGAATLIAPAGVHWAADQATIHAPAASSAKPLVITFTFGPWPTSADGTPAIAMLRDGEAIASCQGFDTVDETTNQVIDTFKRPDPCVQSRKVLADGNTQVVVLSSHASAWNASAPPTNATRPTVTDASNNPPVEADSMTAAFGIWDSNPGVSGSPAPTSIVYQWQRCDVNGANCAYTGSSLTTTNINLHPTRIVQSGDVGRSLRLSVIARNGQPGQTQVFSLATGLVQARPPYDTCPTTCARPSIGGTAMEGQTLTVAHGTWMSSFTFHFYEAWQRCDAALDAQGNAQNCVTVQAYSDTSTTYVVQTADVGHRILSLTKDCNQQAQNGTWSNCGVDGVPTNEVGPLVDLSISVIGAPYDTVGSDVSYQVVVTNNGPDTATGVVLTAVVPSQVVLVQEALDNQDHCPVVSTITCSLGAIASGSSRTLNVTVNLATRGNFSSSLALTTGSFDTQLSNNNSNLRLVGLDDPTTLATEFRPYLRFDSTEQWRPLNVHEFLAQRFVVIPPDIQTGGNQVCQEQSGCVEIDPANPEGFTGVYSTCSPDQLCYLDVFGHGNRGEEYYAPSIEDQTCQPSSSVLLECDVGPSAEAQTIYYHTAIDALGRRVIDYWWFLRYNNVPWDVKFDAGYVGNQDASWEIGNHQGDWEGVTEVVDPLGSQPGGDPAAVAVYYAEHKKGTLATVGSFELANGTRPVVYVANGTHASYPFACLGQDCDTPYLPYPLIHYLISEGSRDGQALWSGDQSCTDCVEEFPSSPTSWTFWPGKQQASSDPDVGVWGDSVRPVDIAIIPSIGVSAPSDKSPTSPGNQMRYRCADAAWVETSQWDCTSMIDPAGSLTSSLLPRALTSSARNPSIAASCASWFGTLTAALGCSARQLHLAQKRLGTSTRGTFSLKVSGPSGKLASGHPLGLAQILHQPLKPRDAITVVGTRTSDFVLALHVKIGSKVWTAVFLGSSLKGSSPVVKVATRDSRPRFTLRGRPLAPAVLSSS